MSKFTDLAAGIKSDLKNFDDQADQLMARREDLRRRGETVFARHREHQAGIAEGLDAMEAVLKDLEGSNSKGNEEGSGDTSSTTFPPKT